jgi:hypothetical protein
MTASLDCSRCRKYLAAVLVCRSSLNPSFFLPDLEHENRSLRFVSTSTGRFTRTVDATNSEVRIHEPGRPVTPMPTKEYGYEMPAAIVVARDREWFQIRTAERPLWVRGTAENSFLSLVQLVSSDSLAYLTQDWDGSIYTNPDGSRARTPMVAPEASVRVLGSRVVSDRLWLLVETDDGCAAPDSSKTVKVRGWIRAYARNGAPAVWFHSRGC